MFRVWRPRDGDGWRGDGAFQFERLYVKVTPWRLVLLASGVGAYLAGLLVFLPAEAALGDERDVVGTVWKGEAALEPGFAAGWSTRPFSSLVSLSARLSSGADGSALTALGPDGAPIATARRTRDGAVALSVLPGAADLLPGVAPVTLETRL